MHLWRAFALLIGFSTLSATARGDECPPVSLDPLKLKCELHQKTFTSEISFSKSPSGELAGELDSYMNQPGHDPCFLNGAIFFDLTVNETSIEGHTGDKRGSVYSFRLYKTSRNLNGYWFFEQKDANGSLSKARFLCHYAD
jgi:hypothetical protein